MFPELTATLKPKPSRPLDKTTGGDVEAPLVQGVEYLYSRTHYEACTFLDQSLAGK